MHIEFLVEEPSIDEALNILLPRILGNISFRIITFNGKPDMLKKLPGQLKGYKSWLPADWRIVVLVDRDRDDCVQLKAELEQAASAAALTTRSVVGGGSYQVLNRIVVEELESWFFGDVAALVAAYPGVSPHLAQQASYRVPDAIRSPAEALGIVLRNAGYHTTGLRKIEAARTITPHMQPQQNRSESFGVFYTALTEMAHSSSVGA